MENRTTILTVDKREKKIIPLLEQQFALGATFGNNVDPNNCPILTDMEAKQIEIGDYIISTHVPDFTSKIGEAKTIVHACIERKTLGDFAASIKDGRLKNFEKMQQFTQETNARLYLLVEGPINPAYNHKIQGIEYSKILASIDSVSLKYGLHIIRTLNPANTAKRLKFLTESHARYFCRYVQVDQSKTFTGGLSEPLGKSTFTPEQKEKRTLVNIWSSVARISYDTALLLIHQYTLREFLNGQIGRESLEAITKPLTGRKLPKNVIEVLCTKPSWAQGASTQAAKFLAQFPLLTTNSARNMLLYNTLEGLANMSAEELKEVKISSGRKCGPVRADKMLAMLDKKYSEKNEIIKPNGTYVTNNISVTANKNGNDGSQSGGEGCSG